MEILVLLALAGLVWFVARKRSADARARELQAAVEDVKALAEEDVTRFGEELQRLDADVKMHLVDQAMHQDWQRALDSYESANRTLRLMQQPDEVRHVTEALEDGRYAVACVLARKAGEPLPVRRPPCFFNPAHGPSTVNVDWAPPGGQERSIPVCAADEDRLSHGAEPDVRTVPAGAGRVPYWQAGPAYQPWAMGYYGAYAGSGLLPGFLIGSLLAPGWSGAPVDGFDTGAGESGGDSGGDGDFGGDAGDPGGDVGGDWGGGSGDWGGGFDGGGGFGGFDGGGF